MPHTIKHTVNFPDVEGIEFFLCGGAVRDILLGTAPKDKDFVMITEKSMDEVISELQKSSNGKTVRIYQVKPQFQTIMCRINDENIDLAFPRKDENEAYSMHRFKGATRIGDLFTDSSRRDYTINAMYMNKEGEILDFQNGMEDIRTKTLRVVGNPDERFKEDPLRILRAVRLSITLGFDIEEETKMALAWNKNLLCGGFLSNDRIKTEINMALKIDPVKTINLLNDLELLAVLNMKDENFKIELTNRQ
jgi:tRNA nucleotidyltransferase/poly(A) polymerase